MHVITDLKYRFRSSGFRPHFCNRVGVVVSEEEIARSVPPEKSEYRTRRTPTVPADTNVACGMEGIEPA